jgi:SOS response regulatory protein OraA/RecX
MKKKDEASVKEDIDKTLANKGIDGATINDALEKKEMDWAITQKEIAETLAVYLQPCL